VNEKILPLPAIRFAGFRRRAAPYHSAEAFSQLFESAHLSVFRYIYGLTGGPTQEVEDLTAEVFLKAWTARDSFEGSAEAALGWLLLIAKRLVIDAYRKRERQKTEPGIEDLIVAAPDASIEEQTITAEQIEILWSLLQDLPDDPREMLVLRYMLGWRVNRIAAHFGIVENTVSVTLRRTISRLQRDWPQEKKS